ncbi:MAG: hypothetical protein ABL902_01165 [Gallionella sp.]
MKSEFLPYHASGSTVWMTQKQLADMYQVGVPAIARHIRYMLAEQKLFSETVVKECLMVATEALWNMERRM